MIPGEIFPAEGTITLNAASDSMVVMVANTGDRPIQVGSHYHFAETNSALAFDRALARGMRLDIAKVIRTEEPQPQVCEVVQVKMTYLSTQGTTETLSYLKLADVCVSNG